MSKKASGQAASPKATSSAPTTPDSDVESKDADAPEERKDKLTERAEALRFELIQETTRVIATLRGMNDIMDDGFTVDQTKIDAAAAKQREAYAQVVDFSKGLDKAQKDYAKGSHDSGDQDPVDILAARTMMNRLRKDLGPEGACQAEMRALRDADEAANAEGAQKRTSSQRKAQAKLANALERALAIERQMQSERELGIFDKPMMMNGKKIMGGITLKQLMQALPQMMKGKSGPMLGSMVWSMIGLAIGASGLGMAFAAPFMLMMMLPMLIDKIKDAIKFSYKTTLGSLPRIQTLDADTLKAQKKADDNAAAESNGSLIEGGDTRGKDLPFALEPGDKGYNGFDEEKGKGTVALAEDGADSRRGSPSALRKGKGKAVSNASRDLTESKGSDASESKNTGGMMRGH